VSIKIMASPQEVAILRQLLHRAVLHGGMDVAEAAVLWGHKLRGAEAADTGEVPQLKAVGGSDAG
jgi:hypothetical protein